MVQSLAPRPLASSALAHERKREILAAASRVFRRQGLSQTGMRDIAAELSMTAGNLYYYFTNKQDLVRFCQETTLDELLSRGERISSLALQADTRLYLLLVAHVICLNAIYPGSLAHFEIETLEEPARAPLLEKRRGYERLYSALIEEGAAAGVFRPVDSRLATLALLGAVNWTVKWFHPERGRSVREVGEEFAELLVRGLLAPGRELARPDAEAYRLLETDAGALV